MINAVRQTKSITNKEDELCQIYLRNEISKELFFHHLGETQYEQLFLKPKS